MKREIRIKSYRWLLALCIAMVAAVVCLVGYLLWLRLDSVDYETRLVQTLGGAGEAGVTAELDGVRTAVTKSNREKLRALLTIYERQRTKRGIEPGEGVIVIRVGERTVILVEEGDRALDETFYSVQTGRWKRSFRTEGYKSYYWIARTVGPEGYYGENAILE